MHERAESWSTHQLTEFLALVSSFADARAATRGAVEHAAEVLDAEVVAVIRGGAVDAAIGYPADALPETELVALADDPQRAHLEGLGDCRVAVVRLETDEPGHLLAARAGSEEFTREELDLLLGMARVLVMTVRMFQRQRLLERLSGLQRMIVRRAEPPDVLHAVVAGAAELVGGAIVSLRLLDPEDPAAAVLMASIGLDPEVQAQTERMPADAGLGGRAMREDRLIVSETPAAMAAPVREEGRVIGTIVVTAPRAGRRYGADDQEALLAFAEHASLALTDARMVRDALHQAFHDPLTDLPNRALFLDRLDLGLSRVQRSKSKLAVLFLDIDRFKFVNDSLGHAAGDELLREVAARLVASIRPGDTAARFGGDEFAILLEDVEGIAAVEHVALRILRALRAPFSVAGRDVFVSASIGIAMEAASAGDMIRDADLAMYRAKAEGKGCHAVFEPAMHVAVVERADLEADLQRVIERDQLVLHYQPIVALGNRAIIGVEALVRWRHPTRGLVAPEAFIPLAEETQVMAELGRWILTEGCREVAAWRGLRPLRLSVNLSAMQLHSADVLAGHVAAALAESGLPPEALVLEITETALMRDVTETISCLRALKKLGVLLAVDDFGTGYSSLDYLRRFPIDILKIDKAFVDDLGAGDATLAQAIIDLGESFDLQVIAEGVEHESQRQRLLELGCSHGQGFYFSRPMPACEFGALLSAAGAVQLPSRR
ncbi:MAG TPA: EAL domain-containing protein [Solirubrobacteraceae bacterium]|nr:EAL domain-containing protein [Solirubrobacteraceae bacterium]